MCNPTNALIATSIASAGLQFQQAKQQQKNAYAQQKRQNEIARKNAIQRYASEQLRIRQEVQKSKDKGFQATLKSRKARAEFLAGAGDAGIAISGSTEALLADYYRVEGNYKSSLAKNLDINIGQYERNLEAIQFGQERQSTYVQPPNPELLFVSSALNVANTYYSLEAQKADRGLMTNKQKRNYPTPNEGADD
jgi:hypothetical protein